MWDPEEWSMFPPSNEPDPSGALIDPAGHEVPPNNALICDNFNVYDKTQIRFTPWRVMMYRGVMYSPKRNFVNLAHELQDIYNRTFGNPAGDFSNYRNNSSTSNSSNGSGPLLQDRDDDDNSVGPLMLDESDADGLLAVPFSIGAAVPLSQAYKQYEPQGYKLISSGRAGHKPLEGLSGKDVKAIADLGRTGKQLGFSREEVVMYGGLSCTPCRPFNLSDPLLTTLFRQYNFYDCPQDVYDVLTPALKLAEKFITDRSSIGYWSTLAFGHRTIDMKLTLATGQCHERLLRNVPVTDEIHAQTLQLLKRLGKVVEYRFHNDNDFMTMKCYGKTTNPQRNWHLAPRYNDMLARGEIWPTDKPFPRARAFSQDPWDDAQVINLHPDFYTTAKRFIATKNQDLAARLRFNFWFAINIGHELAHVFECKSSQAHFEELASTCSTFEEVKKVLQPRIGLGTHEAYWGTSEWAEAGGRWEWQTFGGRVQPINSRADGAHGIQVFRADGHAKFLKSDNIDKPLAFCIPMAYIEEVQQQSFWARPQHSLCMPLRGASAYLNNSMRVFDIDDHLRQRDEDLAASTEPPTDLAAPRSEHVLAPAGARVDQADADEPPSKRHKRDEAFAAAPVITKPTVVKRPDKGRRLRQPLIRRYMKKTDANAQAMHQEAMPRGREAIGMEPTAAEEASRYRSPSPGQRVLHDFFAYPEEDGEHNSLSEAAAEDTYMDPAMKDPDDLTLADKWKLAEEYVCLALDWEPFEFQAQRVDHPNWRPAGLFNPNDPNCFTQEALDNLLIERAFRPGRSWPERHATAKALYEQRKVVAQTMAEMDELITYLGFSRIESHRKHKETGKYPMGMTVLNFPAYRPMLDACRLIQKTQGMSEYVAAVKRGEVSTSASGIGLIDADSKLDPSSEGKKSTKLTDYFKKMTPADARASSASTASLQEKDPDFVELSRMPTPEEDKQAFLAWVAAGAELDRPPKGFHPAQFLSGLLGGSLQTILPSELQKVVAARTQKMEADMVEQKKRAARAKIEAAVEEEEEKKGGEKVEWEFEHGE